LPVLFWKSIEKRDRADYNKSMQLHLNINGGLFYVL
jgi:hypothetical protein